MTNLYFARSLIGDAIKVGVSQNPAKRMKAINAELVLTLPLGVDAEARILKVFAEDILSGEYLRPVPALVALIEIAKGRGAEGLFEELARLEDVARELPMSYSYELSDSPVTVIA